VAQWIVKDFARPDPELVRRCATVPTGILGDCMNRFQSMNAGVQALVPGRRVCGPAFTVASMESCNWGGHQALAAAAPGDVLVIAARGGMQNAVWGHVMTVAAKKRGLAGVVIDGCIRDARENREVDFPIFCRGACPGGPHKGWPCNLNVPVSCGGVAVLPGDIVVADDDGVVVVPPGRAPEVLNEAEGRMALEQDWFRRLERGETTLSLLGIKPV
jgi:4-hydroxy-4-methyl-2-oxoglutarate aldolase